MVADTVERLWVALGSHSRSSLRKPRLKALSDLKQRLEKTNS